jgi:hypothetical protein
MLTVEECRRKASEHLRAAEEARDLNTGDSLRRVSDLWTKLARQIEQDRPRQRQAGPPVRRLADLFRPRMIGNADTVHVADILRERLQLSDLSADEPTQ